MRKSKIIKQKKIKKLIKEMKTKVWNLHRETLEWRKDIERFTKRYNKLQKQIQEKSHNFVTQEGKIIFLSWLLNELGEGKLIAKIWKERGWKTEFTDKEKNKIIKNKKICKKKLK